MLRRDHEREDARKTRAISGYMHTELCEENDHKERSQFYSLASERHSTKGDDDSRGIKGERERQQDLAIEWMSAEQILAKERT